MKESRKTIATISEENSYLKARDDELVANLEEANKDFQKIVKSLAHAKSPAEKKKIFDDIQDFYKERIQVVRGSKEVRLF